MKPIAVLADNIQGTFKWLRDCYGTDIINVSNKTATNTQTGQVYVIICNDEHAYAWEFSGMVKSPFYHTLEDTVRSRIK